MKAETKRHIRAWAARAAIWTARGIIHLCQAALGWLDRRLMEASDPLQRRGRQDFVPATRSSGRSIQGRPRLGARFAAECASRRMQQRNFFKRLRESRDFAEDIRAARESVQIEETVQ